MQKRQGLTSAEAAKRLKEYGLNEITDIGKLSALRILVRQIKKNFVIYLLAVAAILAFALGKTVTAYVVVAVILIVIGTGFFQEYRAERAVDTLKRMIKPSCLVIRNGKEQEIPATHLVPGDILVLRTGERIPADARVLHETDVLVNEAILTGESQAVRKTPSRSGKTPERGMLFMGTFIVSGKCTAQVLHTGMDTKFGKIARLISTTEKDLPLQDKVNAIAKYMAIIGVTMSTLTGALILFSHDTITSEVITGVLILIIAFSVSSFPEGFPVVLVTALAAGAYNMARKNAIVNRMSIIETLGETTIICSDKTGTITKGEMTAKELWCAGSAYSISGVGYDLAGTFNKGTRQIDPAANPALQLLLRTAVLCNDATISRAGDHGLTLIGSPTESALLVLAAKAGLHKDDFSITREAELPFTSERKMMSVLARQGRQYTVYAKGAPEFLLKNCTHIQTATGIQPLSEAQKKKILARNSTWTSKTYRTLGLAYRPQNTRTKKWDELIFIGLVAMEDPPREEVKEAIRMCKRAGIQVKMITGDNRETALAIARQIGLPHASVLDGTDLDTLSDKELIHAVKATTVFARVRPEHKIRIVTALKARGEIVTMTGDGVNDAPALKEAHIGVAMGKAGTDVSRSVADLTLKDDNFATLVDAIREGRTIFNNIRKFVSYQLSCNFAELFMLFIGVLAAPLLGWPVPILLALHVLFMNIVTDNLPAITLGFNPSSKDVMIAAPRKNSAILDKQLIILLCSAGLTMGILALAVFTFTFTIMGETAEFARSTALLSLILLQIGGAFCFRSFRQNVLHRSIFVNKYLVLASTLSLAATIAVLYTPLNIIFETAPLPAHDWIVALAVTLFYISIFDLFKALNNRYKWLTL